MASKNLVLKGATWNGVESVDFPVSGGGTARYVETSDADATASDIASGKTAYVNGSLVTGTASPSTPTTPIIGALRPDATIVQSWTYDKLLVQDEGITIPAYTTTQTTLRSYSTVTTNTIDPDNYDYILCGRLLLTPIYSSSTKGKGREICYASSCISEFITTKPTLESSTASSRVNTIYHGYAARYCYWTSDTATSNVSSSNGINASLSNASTVVNTPAITFYIPSVTIKGSTTYFTQTFWDMLTDIRFQYKFELYKVARTGIYGFNVTSQMQHVFDCANSVSGDLS